MNNQIRILLLWTILVICMILHFDYQVSGIFYGIDVRHPKSEGTVPLSILYIRTAFHFLPLLFVLILMWWSSKTARRINFLLSIVYCLSHGIHFAGELHQGGNPSQAMLLGITFIISFTLAVASWLWKKQQY